MKIIKNIGELVGIVPEGVSRKVGPEMDEVSSLKNAFLSFDNGMIMDFGPSVDCPDAKETDEVIDARGGMVMPMFCDSHTHICHAGSREQEFIDKINGLSYEEYYKKLYYICPDYAPQIPQSGGGEGAENGQGNDQRVP